MTSRQARKQRREEEREAAKLAYQQSRIVAAPACQTDDEFSPEFIAEAQATRQRIEACILTNRANALHSTGPRSAEGKLASSRNSLKHGLASGQLIVSGEDPAEYDSLLQCLFAEHQPANTSEEILIHQMAQSVWLTQRALRLQNECFTATGIDEKRLALFLRYQTTHERAFHRALPTLMRLQNDRRHTEKAPRGFVSQQRTMTAPETDCLSQNPSPAAPESPSAPQNSPPTALADAA